VDLIFGAPLFPISSQPTATLLADLLVLLCTWTVSLLCWENCFSTPTLTPLHVRLFLTSCLFTLFLVLLRTTDELTCCQMCLQGKRSPPLLQILPPYYVDSVRFFLSPFPRRLVLFALLQVRSVSFHHPILKTEFTPFLSLGTNVARRPSFKFRAVASSGELLDR